MKGIALGIASLGILLASAAPSLADHWHGYDHGPYHHHGHYYYSGYAPVVVAPAAPIVVAPATPVVATPSCGYSAYAPYPAVAPVYPVVAPRPYYYGPSVSFGVRTHGLAVGVGF
jgi:hypothetical protein